MKGKKVIHWEGGGLGEWGNCPNWFLDVKFCYLLGYPSILLGYLSNNHTFMPSIGFWCVIIHLYIIHVIYIALLKSDVSGQSKAFSSHSFQPTGIGLGSLWRAKSFTAYYQLSRLTYKLIIFFFTFLKLLILPKKKKTL